MEELLINVNQMRGTVRSLLAVSPCESLSQLNFIICLCADADHGRWARYGVHRHTPRVRDNMAKSEHLVASIRHRRRWWLSHSAEVAR